MKVPLGSLLLVVTIISFCGCSSVQSRIREKRKAFEKLPPRQQELVVHGRVGAGMSPDAVYMAWGKPDEITRGARATQQFETWTYYVATQQAVPHYPYTPRVIGRHVFTDAIYDPYYVMNWYPYRAVTFVDGRVISGQAAAGSTF